MENVKRIQQIIDESKDLREAVNKVEFPHELDLERLGNSPIYAAFYYSSQDREYVDYVIGAIDSETFLTIKGLLQNDYFIFYFDKMKVEDYELESLPYLNMRLKVADNFRLKSLFDFPHLEPHPMNNNGMWSINNILAVINTVAARIKGVEVSIQPAIAA